MMIQVNGSPSRATTHGRGWWRFAAPWLVTVATLLSLAAFFYPFLLPSLIRATSSPTASRSAEAPLILAGIASLCAVMLLMQSASSHSRTNSPAKSAALLGAVVAIDACLRLAPSLGGASAVFLLIILAGSVFGARFGYLTGALSLFLSAFLTGGIGPWLPFQMIGAGWVGLAAAWIPRPGSRRRRILYLCLYGAVAGFLYGALLNLYSWPFAAPGLDETAGLYWHPGLGLGDTIQRYASFYLVTSFSHDALRAIGNGVLLVILGPPLLTTLERARRRLSWQSVDEPRSVDIHRQGQTSNHLTR